VIESDVVIIKNSSLALKENFHIVIKKNCNVTTHQDIIHTIQKYVIAKQYISYHLACNDMIY